VGPIHGRLERTRHNIRRAFCRFRALNRVLCSEDFANPERGFYIARSYNPDNNPQPLNPAQLRRARNNSMTLMHMDWFLSEFRDRPLSSAMLDRIRADLAAARDTGLKVIGRFLYNSGPEDAPDAPLARVLAHLDQLRPVLRENSDVLTLLEAGFVGNWGE